MRKKKMLWMSDQHQLLKDMRVNKMISEGKLHVQQSFNKFSQLKQENG